MDLETKWMLVDYKKFITDTTFLLKTYIVVDNLQKTMNKICSEEAFLT